MSYEHLIIVRKEATVIFRLLSVFVSEFHNFTQTYFADHTEKWSHDQLNRLLREERVSAGNLWRWVKSDIAFDPDGYLLFDDIVVEKGYAKSMQLVRRQWSGSEKRAVEGTVSSRASMSTQRRRSIGS